MPSIDQQSLAWLRTHHADHLHRSAAGLWRQPRPAQAPRRGWDAAPSRGRRVRLRRLATSTSWRGALRCARSRPQLVVAGPTAGRLWQIRRSPRDGLIHVLAPPHSHPCREHWLRPYRTALIFDDEVVRRARWHPVDEPTAHRRRSDQVRRCRRACLDDRGRAESPAVHGCNLQRTALRARHARSAVGQAFPWCARSPSSRTAGRVGRRTSRVRRRSSHEVSEPLGARCASSSLAMAGRDSTSPSLRCSGPSEWTSTRSTAPASGSAHDNVRDDCADVGRVVRRPASELTRDRVHIERHLRRAPSIAWSPRSNDARVDADERCVPLVRWPPQRSQPSP